MLSFGLFVAPCSEIDTNTLEVEFELLECVVSEADRASEASRHRKRRMSTRPLSAAASLKSRTWSHDERACSHPFRAFHNGFGGNLIV